MRRTASYVAQGSAQRACARLRLTLWMSQAAIVAAIIPLSTADAQTITLRCIDRQYPHNDPVIVFLEESSRPEAEIRGQTRRFVDGQRFRYNSDAYGHYICPFSGVDFVRNTRESIVFGYSAHSDRPCGDPPEMQNEQLTYRIDKVSGTAVLSGMADADSTGGPFDCQVVTGPAIP